MKNNKNVSQYAFGAGSVSLINELIKEHRTPEHKSAVFLVDSFFDGKFDLLNPLVILQSDFLFYVHTDAEPTTEMVDLMTERIRHEMKELPCAIVGIGGGITLDTAKAVSNLLTNPGCAENYQGWDLVERPGIYKIGVPTISGTGAESSRTCVLTNKKKNIKLGMNSNFTMFDQIVLDPNLSATVPRNQFFYTGMDAYIHCIESLSGSYRNAIADSLSRECVQLCREVFLSENMMTSENREKLMVASYLGGAAIASTYVGVVHPLSAALSVVFGTHHCLANCVVMKTMEQFYTGAHKEYTGMLHKQNIELPRIVPSDTTEETFRALYDSCIVHERPLSNALGQDFKKILTFETAKRLFSQM